MKKETFKAIKERDIETVLWNIVEDSLKEFNVSQNCKVGRATFSSILNTLSQFEMIRRKRIDKDLDASQTAEEYSMKEWLTVINGDKE